MKKLRPEIAFYLLFHFVLAVRSMRLPPMEKCNFENVQNHSKHQTMQNVHFIQCLSFFDLLGIWLLLYVFVNKCFCCQKCLAVTYFRSCSKWMDFFFILNLKSAFFTNILNAIWIGLEIWIHQWIISTFLNFFFWRMQNICEKKNGRAIFVIVSFMRQQRFRWHFARIFKLEKLTISPFAIFGSEILLLL